MINLHYSYEIETPSAPTFFDITDDIFTFVSKSNIQNGIVTVYSQHTSCCVIIQEESEDTTYTNTQFILQDMLNAFHKIIPQCNYEGQYLHPGPIHINNAIELRNEKAEWGLNTDGHLISCILGRSETIPIKDGKLLLGEFGRIYFGDLDRIRCRKRTIRAHFIGE